MHNELQEISYYILLLYFVIIVNFIVYLIFESNRHLNAFFVR